MIGFLSGITGTHRRTEAKYDAVTRHVDADATRTLQGLTEPVSDAPALPSNSSSVVLEFSAIKQDAIHMMAELPAEMNAEIAEIIRGKVRAGDWPKGLEASNSAIKGLMRERLQKLG